MENSKAIEMNTEELDSVSGGAIRYDNYTGCYYNEKGERCLSSGEAYRDLNALERYNKIALAMYEKDGNWDLAETFIRNLGYGISQGEFSRHGTVQWLHRVRGTTVWGLGFC